MLRPSRDYRTYDGDALVANACLKVEGSSLVAVDSLGGVHRFPLDGGPKAPAVVAHVVDLTPSPYSDLSALAVFDGEGKALVTAPHDAFDPMGAGIFARTARLRYELDPDQAAARARSYLAQVGHRGTVTVSGDTVSTTVEIDQPLQILGIGGLGQVTVTGQGEARTVRGVERGET